MRFSPFKSYLIASLVCASTLVAVAKTADAAVLYNLTQNGAFLFGANSGPYGTVSVTDNLDGSLTILETLNGNYSFNKNNNDQHQALSFDLSASSILISSLTAGFVPNSSSFLA